MKKLISKIYIGLSLSISAGASAGEFAVIAHESATVDEVSSDVIARMMLRKTSQWPDGTKVMPVDQLASSETRETFSKEMLGKTMNAVHAYWQQQVFAGRGLPPPTRESDAEVVAYVAATPGALGYVSAGADTTNTKRIPIE